MVPNSPACAASAAFTPNRVAALGINVLLFANLAVAGVLGVRALDGYALSAVERSPRFRQIEAAVVGDDHMRRYVRV